MDLRRGTLIAFVAATASGLSRTDLAVTRPATLGHMDPKAIESQQGSLRGVEETSNELTGAYP